MKKTTTMLLDITGKEISLIFLVITKKKIVDERKTCVNVFIFCHKCIVCAFVSCSPKKMFDSYNEVWYVVNGEPVCSSSEEMG